MVCLKREDMETFGDLMTISHDGERRFVVADDLPRRSRSRLTSGQLSPGPGGRSRKRRSRGVEQAQVHRQPGTYRCSTREVDGLIDLGCGRRASRPQIAGAGLGGLPWYWRKNWPFLGSSSGSTHCTTTARAYLQESAFARRRREVALSLLRHDDS